MSHKSDWQNYLPINHSLCAARFHLAAKWHEASSETISKSEKYDFKKRSSLTYDSCCNLHSKTISNDFWRLENNDRCHSKFIRLPNDVSNSLLVGRLQEQKKNAICFKLCRFFLWVLLWEAQLVAISFRTVI